MRFLVAVEPGTDVAAFGVVVPDLPGCFSAGDSLPEALANAIEAIQGHLAILAADGCAAPKALDAALHMANPEYGGMEWHYVNAVL